MVISLIFAVVVLGVHRGTAMKKIGQSMENAVKQIAMMLLIIGGAGAFKQVLVTGGVADDISALFMHSNISPLVAAWLIPALLHLLRLNDRGCIDWCRTSSTVGCWNDR